MRLVTVTIAKIIHIWPFKQNITRNVHQQNLKLNKILITLSICIEIDSQVVLEPDQIWSILLFYYYYFFWSMVRIFYKMLLQIILLRIVPYFFSLINAKTVNNLGKNCIVWAMPYLSGTVLGFPPLICLYGHKWTFLVVDLQGCFWWWAQSCLLPKFL